MKKFKKKRKTIELVFHIDVGEYADNGQVIEGWVSEGENRVYFMGNDNCKHWVYYNMLNEKDYPVTSIKEQRNRTLSKIFQ